MCRKGNNHGPKKTIKGNNSREIIQGRLFKGGNYLYRTRMV